MIYLRQIDSSLVSEVSEDAERRVQSYNRIMKKVGYLPLMNSYNLYIVLFTLKNEMKDISALQITF